jgi:Family of unknown function (DUF6065)
MCNAENRAVPWLRAWRLHPGAGNIEAADSTLGGEVPVSARRYCMPFIEANRAGWYIYSPVDLDVSYCSEREEQWEMDWISGYVEDSELEVLADLADNGLIDGRVVRPRNKLVLSERGDEPSATLQIWTGYVFKTSPGWNLWVRGPINRSFDLPYHVDESIIRTDLVARDIWINLRFYRPSELARIRRSGLPLAHFLLVPADLGHDLSVLDVDSTDLECRGWLKEWGSFETEKFFSADVKVRETYNRRIKHK